MATANFWTMKDFPLYVHDDFEMAECPHCGTYIREQEIKDELGFCPYCMEEVHWGDLDKRHDAFEAELWYDDLSKYLDNLNDSLTFHSLAVKSGYYEGYQIYVKETEDPNDLDNGDCHYYFDLCRSKAIRKFNSEKNKIRKMLKQTASDWGMYEIYCLGHFSNGEAVYQRVPNEKSTKRERIAHACATI